MEINSLRFAIFCSKKTNKGWSYENALGLYPPDWELSFYVRIAIQTILLKVVQVNNATDANITRRILLPITHNKAYLPNIGN